MAEEKAIALDKLARALNKLRDTGLPLNNWQAGKKYKVNYPVLHENKIYRCIEAHTASSTFDETKWETVSSADSGLKTWGENILYKTGDIVIYGNGIYQCITEHTSTSTFDTTNWTNLSVGYAKKPLYTSNAYSTESTTITTSESMLNKDFIIIKIAYSIDGTSVKMNKSYVIAPVVGEVHDFSYQESTTSYIALTGKILNNTTLQFNFTEAQNLTKFKVISIDSLSLGSSSGGSEGTNISDWETGTTYSVGDLVIHDNNIYQCNTNHTSTTFTADASKWTLIGGGASEELYSSNTWLATDTNLTLSSAVTPYDFIIIKVDCSLDGTSNEISKTVIATNALNTNISLTLNRNSTQYCVLEGQLTSSTVFAVDALELAGFTKFRVNKIIGIIGGGSGDSSTPATSAQIQSLF